VLPVSPRLSESEHTRRLLLRYVLDNPADDPPRLAYADHCAGSGDGERAEFIRAQCGVEQTPCQDPRWVFEFPPREPDCPHCALERRAYSLLEKHCGTCEPELSRVFLRFLGSGAGRPPCAWGWCRGFVAEVRCACPIWMKHGPAVVAGHPVVRVTLSNKRPAACPGPAYWSAPVGGDVVHELPAELFPHLPGVTTAEQRLHYPAEEDALDAASQAALRWARAEAGRRGLLP
jgi:uncharacterized protein (TIGR02996 family)